MMKDIDPAQSKGVYALYCLPIADPLKFILKHFLTYAPTYLPKSRCDRKLTKSCKHTVTNKVPT